MISHIRTLDRKESAGSDVKADILTVNALGGDIVQYRLREMQSRPPLPLWQL